MTVTDWLTPQEVAEQIGVGRAKVVAIEVKSVVTEPLCRIEPWEVAAEGFPEMTPEEFVAFYCREMKCEPGQMVQVITFKRLEVKL